MINYVLRRLVSTMPVLLVVAIIVFLIIRLAPGDPALAMAGDGATSEDLARLRAALGIDQPLWYQFWVWLLQLIQLDFGYSLYHRISVWSLIGQRIGPTLYLAGLTMLITVPIAIPLGAFAAWRQGERLDRWLSGLAVMGFSIPVFVVAYLLIWFFSVKLGWFPVQGAGGDDASLFQKLRYMVLPAVGLALGQIALLARVTRAAVIDTLAEDYVKTARAKGASDMRALWRHAVRNASIPIMTVIGLSFVVLIGGVVVTETIYALPGLGKLTVDSVLARDFPVVQGIVIFFSLIYVAINLLVDLSYALLDPRIRY